MLALCLFSILIEKVKFRCIYNNLRLRMPGMDHEEQILRVSSFQPDTAHSTEMCVLSSPSIHVLVQDPFPFNSFLISLKRALRFECFSLPILLNSNKTQNTHQSQDACEIRHKMFRRRELMYIRRQIGQLHLRKMTINISAR